MTSIACVWCARAAASLPCFLSRHHHPAPLSSVFLLQPGTQVVVHGLPFRFSWQELKDLARCALGCEL